MLRIIWINVEKEQKADDREVCRCLPSCDEINSAHNTVMGSDERINLVKQSDHKRKMKQQSLSNTSVIQFVYQFYSITK